MVGTVPLSEAVALLTVTAVLLMPPNLPAVLPLQLGTSVSLVLPPSQPVSTLGVLPVGWVQF